MKKIGGLVFILILTFVFSLIYKNGVSAASDTCVVTPTSSSVAQGGFVDFSVTSSRKSTSLDYIYVSAVGFEDGTYSDLGPGKIIPVGSNSLSFKIYAENNAKTGTKDVRVYCATGCPYGGCPGGGQAEVIDYKTISLSVTGDNTSGGGGSNSVCSVDSSITLLPNSSYLANFSFPDEAGSINNGSIELFGSSSTNSLSVIPLFPRVNISNGRWNGSGAVLLKTGPDFKGGTYSVTSDINGKKCKANGSAILPFISNTSGKIKLTQHNSLTNILFPDSGCREENMYGTGSGSGCRYGFYGGSGPEVKNYSDSSRLEGGDLMRSTFSRIIPKSFSLEDPMNPKFVSGGVVTYSADSVKGEHGMTTPSLSTISKDGKYSAVLTNYSLLAMNSPQKSKITMEGDFLSGTSNIDILKVNSNYILLYDWGAKNITNLNDIEAPLPDDFPDFNDPEFFGRKIVIGDGSHVLVHANSPSDSTKKQNDLLLFSIYEDRPIAKFVLPEDSSKFNLYGSVEIPFKNGIYLLTRSSNSSYDYVLNLFKIDYVNKKINWEIKNASTVEFAKEYGKNILSYAPMALFDFGDGNMGVIIFTTKGIKAFSLADVAAGKWENILSNYYPDTNERTPTGFMVKNGVTYVYTSRDNGKEVNVWKFEKNNSNTIVPPTYTDPTKYPTPPEINPNGSLGCPRGMVYQTSAGPLCIDSSSGVTTTTSFNFDSTVLPTPPTPGCMIGGIYDVYTGKKCEETR